MFSTEISAVVMALREDEKGWYNLQTPCDTFGKWTNEPRGWGFFWDNLLDTDLWQVWCSDEDFL